jgi:uncharacterized protein YciU (UPF0263 family)
MIIDSDGILEFYDDIYIQLRSGKLDKQNILLLAQQHCSKTEQKLLNSFIISS